MPRGGVAVGFEIARALNAPLDIVLVRKIGVPWQPELALGAVTDGTSPETFINRHMAAVLVPSRFVLEFDWRGLRLDEDTWSGSKVNRLIGEFLGQALPSVHFAHSDLT